MRRRFFNLFVAMVVLLGGCAVAPLPPAARVAVATLPRAEQARAERNLAVFRRVWGLVEAHQYDPKFNGVDWDAAAVTFAAKAAGARDEFELYRVLNAMLEPLHDSHTHALRPEQARERHTQRRVRAGFRMTRVENRWIVSEVLPESPAGKAGVKDGWIVLSRNGEPLPERPDFRATVGEELQWEFIDERDQRVVLSTRAELLSLAPRQVARELEGGFVYLRFDEFDGRDRRWLSRELKAHGNAAGVVVDLRWNGGGDTFSLGTAIGEFFDTAVDCGTFITRSGRRHVKSSWQLGSAHYRGKVVVLVDAASASAAEIFTAVLQDYGRATVVGRKTAGAVLASWFYRLPDGGELQLSQEDYVAPEGRRIEAGGIEPDVAVARTLADVRAGRDRDLAEALRVLRGDGKP